MSRLVTVNLMSNSLPAAIFRLTFSHAASHNLRLITITARGYPGSSPLTGSSLDDLSASSPDEAGAALFDHVKDIAFLIARLIKSEGLPAPIEIGGTKLGGVSILGWSGGNAFLLSLLANISALDEDIATVLGQHVTYALIYGRN